MTQARSQTPQCRSSLPLVMRPATASLASLIGSARSQACHVVVVTHIPSVT